MGDILFLLVLIIVGIVALAFFINLVVYVYVILTGRKIMRMSTHEMMREIEKHAKRRGR
jgi:type III secretory pathway component EscU